MENITLVYDGECPFCSTYARFMRLKDAAGDLRLVNARDANHPVVQDVKSRGYNLDDGMVVIIGGKYYHADEALHVLALMSSRSGIFNRFNYQVFSSPALSRFFYPSLRAGRNIALCLKGAGKIHS